jgi:hypothetical protein
MESIDTDFNFFLDDDSQEQASVSGKQQFSTLTREYTSSTSPPQASHPLAYTVNNIINAEHGRLILAGDGQVYHEYTEDSPRKHPASVGEKMYELVFDDNTIKPYTVSKVDEINTHDDSIYYEYAFEEDDEEATWSSTHFEFYFLVPVSSKLYASIKERYVLATERTRVQLPQEVKNINDLRDNLDITTHPRSKLEKTVKISSSQTSAFTSHQSQRTDDASDDTSPGQQSQTYAYQTRVSATHKGKRLHTSMFAFKQGDKAYWQYEPNLFTMVTILDARLQPGTIAHDYLIEIDASKEQHNVLHRDLFTEDSFVPSPLGHDPTKLPLTTSQMLFQTRNPDISEERIRLFDSFTLGKFNPTKLPNLLKDITCRGDDPMSVLQWLSDLGLSISLNHADNEEIFPMLVTITNGFTFEGYFLPPQEHHMFAHNLACYKKLGAILMKYLKKHGVFTKGSELKRIVQQHSAQPNGFVVLDSILRRVLPQLGGRPLNPQHMLDRLILRNGTDIYVWLDSLDRLYRMVKASGLDFQLNALPTHILDWLSRSENHISSSFMKSSFPC